jgi:hypothetical protein
MAGLAEWWRSMPREKQLLTAFAAFWLFYVCAAIYDWSVPGSLDDPTTYAVASGMPRAVTTEATAGSAAAATPAAGGLTTGDIVVLMAAAFIAISLGIVGVLAWREVRGPVQEPGMSSGDDPLWSRGDIQP